MTPNIAETMTTGHDLRADVLARDADGIGVPHRCTAEFVDLDRRTHAASIQSRAMWTTIRKFQDIKYERTEDGTAKITINRPEVRNAFRPQTVSELKEAFDLARRLRHRRRDPHWRRARRILLGGDQRARSGLVMTRKASPG